MPRRAEHRRAMSAPSPVRVQSAKAASFLACSEWAGPHAEGTEAVAGYPQLEVGLKSEPVSRDPVLLKQGWSLSHRPAAVLVISSGAAGHCVNSAPLGHHGPQRPDVSDYWTCRLPHADSAGLLTDAHLTQWMQERGCGGPGAWHQQVCGSNSCWWLCEPSAWRTPGLIPCISIVEMRLGAVAMYFVRPQNGGRQRRKAHLSGQLLWRNTQWLLSKWNYPVAALQVDAHQSCLPHISSETEVRLFTSTAGEQILPETRLRQPQNKDEDCIISSAVSDRQNSTHTPSQRDNVQHTLRKM